MVEAEAAKAKEVLTKRTEQKAQAVTTEAKTGLLLVRLPIAFAIGGVVWLLALGLLRRGARRFTRDRLAAAV